MNHPPRYDRLIIALNDDELEGFVREWALKKTEYLEVQRFTGPGDMGPDVVGYLSKKRHEGPWHNYQCKQYGKSLQTAVGLREIGKLLYFSFCGEFVPPTAYFFVTPRGVNRNLKRLIANPGQFRTELIITWDAYCANEISDGKNIPLDASLRAFIEAWDFSAIRALSVDDILSDAVVRPALYKWFGADPGGPPLGQVPTSIESREMPYIGQLLDAYGERDNTSFPDYASLQTHADHDEHLRYQRERFFDADAFARFYRDNTMHEEIDMLRRDVLHGVVDTYRAAYADTLTRVDAVMTQAANLQPSGALAKYAGVPIKQGICHHFVNEGQMKWRKT